MKILTESKIITRDGTECSVSIQEGKVIISTPKGQVEATDANEYEKRAYYLSQDKKTERRVNLDKLGNVEILKAFLNTVKKPRKLCVFESHVEYYESVDTDKSYGVSFEVVENAGTDIENRLWCAYKYD